MREASAASWGEQELAEITAAFMFAVITVGNVGGCGGGGGGGGGRVGGQIPVTAAALYVLQQFFASFIFPNSHHRRREERKPDQLPDGEPGSRKTQPPTTLLMPTHTHARTHAGKHTLPDGPTGGRTIARIEKRSAGLKLDATADKQTGSRSGAIVIGSL